MTTLPCSPYTEYEFGVLAVNNVGRGKKSIAALATTGETSKIMMIGFRWFRLVQLERAKEFLAGKISQTFRVSISDFSDSAVTFLVGFLISVSEE